MSVKIRLKRFGTTRRPYYRIVVMDTRTTRDGRTLDEVGTYHPIESADKQLSLREDSIREWLSKGALPSPTVKKLLNSRNIVLA